MQPDRVHPIVRQIIDRDCHVSMNNRSVIRHVVSKLKEGLRTFRALPKQDRRRFMTDCIRVHADNRKLYAYVMGGARSRRSRSPRPKGSN